MVGLHILKFRIQIFIFVSALLGVLFISIWPAILMFFRYYFILAFISLVRNFVLYCLRKNTISA